MIPREAVATPEDVRNALALTDEQRAELQEQQLKIFRSRAKLTPEEMQLGRAVELERHYRKIGNMDSLAEALAQQGRFREAAETAVREDLKKVLTEKAEAVERDDEDCACPTYYSHDDLHLPNQHIEANVYSEKHGAILPAIRCRVCKTLNVRPILPHLAELRAVRAESVKNEGRQMKATEYFRQPR